MDRNFTIDEFTRWVLEQDPKKSFDYMDNYNCPIAQFLKDTGRFVRPAVGCGDADEYEDHRGESHIEWDDELDHVIANVDSTFGALGRALQEHGASA